MSNCVLEKIHYIKKPASAESQHIFAEIYGEHELADQACQKLFARFKSDYFGLKYEERSGRPSADCCQTHEELAEPLGATTTT